MNPDAPETCPTFTVEDNNCRDCGKSLSECNCAGAR